MSKPPVAPPPSTVAGPRLAARAVDLVREYGTGSSRVRALDGLSVDLVERRFTAVMGASGSGKSTFLHCLAGLDRATSGQMLLGGTDLGALDDAALTAIRRDRLGFVFQDGNLLPHLTAGENIDLAASLAGRRTDRAWRRELVERLGVADRLRHLPSQLSGGQRQRVAVVRALLGRPDLVVADEPTGALDSESGAALLALLRACVDEFGQTVVMVTHDPSAAAVTDEVVLLRDGRAAGRVDRPTRRTVLERLGELAAPAGVVA
ncbi:ABC transporter ATP-binding protein [Cellulomonas sp. HD19AZ1]|uniref:ABC transporter ATP-binding protein n=1 Tax=Cellulomonas sp. HD19AZ1 TaxID=2559593 RepID=UPI00107148ED|nr:ABC transporter ATP-binding protein [Cellulomonas sp. HD19AZ1]TFH69440.1 ABC transporter ATP-binding protein [Cellulomonas sp. HD19AZ1]